MSDVPSLSLNQMLAKAEQHMAVGEFTAAFFWFEQTLNRDETCSAAYHGLGVIYAQRGQYDVACDCLTRAVRLDESNAVIHCHLANVLSAMGQFNDAEHHYQKAIECCPSNPDPHNNWGNLHLKRKDWREAERCYRQAIALGPDTPDAHFNVGRLYVAQARYEAARPHLMEANRLRAKHIPTLTALGISLEKCHAVEEAIACFEQVVALDARHPQALHHLALCLISQQRLIEAKPYLETLLSITPTDPTISYNLAVIATAQDNIEEAINYYKASLVLHPASVAANTNIANLYLRIGDEASAIGYFNNVLKVEPNNQAVLFRLAAITQSEHRHLSPTDYVQGLFDYYAKRYDEDLVTQLHYAVPERFKAILASQPVRQRCRILDCGCGTGLCGQAIKPFATTLVGIDLSEKMLQCARDKKCYDKLMQGEVVSLLNNMQEQYDVLLAGDVLSYLGDLQAFFKACSCVMAANACLVVTTERAQEGVAEYQLCKTTRFEHNPDYVRAVAVHNGLQTAFCEPMTLRTQLDRPVKGDVFVFRHL